jgi:uncharacterized protein (TIGR03118 family)
MKLSQLISVSALAFSAMGALCFGQNYQQTNLVANNSGKTPDADLVDPWGMSRSSGSPWWIADAGSGKSTLYAGDGTKEGLVVTIPGETASAKGAPTGAIFNGSKTAFKAGGKPASFLFATLQGTISGWNGGAAAIIVAKGKKGSAYTGLTSATVDGRSYLYAANYALGTVDVFSSSFKPVTFDLGTYEGAAFFDDLLPSNYVPYNVQVIGNDIVVTYAYLPSGAFFPEAGLGWGYVDIYSANGYLKQRLEHGQWLNAPWGIALAPTDFGTYSHDLLIGNFANGKGSAADYSGTIAAYDLVSGHYVGQLLDAAGKPLAIQGLWALSPGNVSPTNLDAAASPAAAIYFTAGPNGGKDGLLGYLTAVSADLTQGNDQ